MNNQRGAIENWRHFGGKCGPGSTIKNTRQTRQFLEDIVDKYDIKSISDAGCGMFNWMKLIDLTKVQYTGYDINNLVINTNKKTYPNVVFREFDIVNQVLPKTDLIVCRDCLFHLPNKFILKCLSNFKNSNSTFLFSTSHLNVKENVDIKNSDKGMEYGFRRIDLHKKPFLLGNSIENVKEPYDRIVALWDLSEQEIVQ